MSATPQVVLRPLEVADRDRLLAWRNLPEIGRWMFSDHTITPQEHARWFAGALVDPCRRYWIIEADGKPVGLANLDKIDWLQRTASLGIYIGQPSDRGAGLGRLATALVIDHAFSRLNLRRVGLEVLASNAPARRLYERLGFRLEGVLRQSFLRAGEPEDVALYSLLQAEWTLALPEGSHRLLDGGLSS